MSDPRRKLDEALPEWMDLRALQQYACICERTLRQWIHRAINPLPASCAGKKILVRRSDFDHWLESQRILPDGQVDLDSIVDDVLKAVVGAD